MRYLKCLLACMCVGLALSLAVGCEKSKEETVSYTYNTYFEIGTIVEDSTDIVKGKIIDFRTESINISLDENEMIRDYVVMDVLVTDNVKGENKKDDVIQVKYPVELKNEFDEKLLRNEEYLLFLINYNDVDENMPMSLVNAEQSVVDFNVDVYAFGNDEDDELDIFKNIPKNELVDYIRDNYINK